MAQIKEVHLQATETLKLNGVNACIQYLKSVGYGLQYALDFIRTTRREHYQDMMIAMKGEQNNEAI